MITIPLNPYSDRMPDGRPKTASVSADEGALTLALDVDPREVWRTWKRPASELEELLERWGDTVGTSPSLVPDAQLLLDEVHRLREQLASAVDSVDVHPAPDEARALAAALVHFAGEIESGRA